MKVYLNGKELPFAEGGYEYVFMKPYKRHIQDVKKQTNGELTLQVYDNGVQIRTLVTAEEVATLVNRDVAIDRINKKIYILEADSRVKELEDGSIEVIK